ncbi:MAG: LamG domain-containing protein [Gemmatimonadales bacterium]
MAVAHDPVFEVAEGSIQLWFNTRDANEKQTLFAKDQDGRSNGLRITLDDRDLEVRLEDGRNVHRIDTDDNPVRSNTWYQLTFTFGPAGMKLYLNGVLVGSNAYAGGLAGNREPIVIGGSNDHDNGEPDKLGRIKIKFPFDGHIDEVAFYGAALSAEQIAETRARSALGVVGPQDAGDELISVERLEFYDAPLVVTAAPGAGGEVDVAPEEDAGGWSVRWPHLDELLDGLKFHGLRELFEELKGEGLKLFGHTGGKPALFSTEGIELDEDGRAAPHKPAKTVHGLEGWIDEARKHEDGGPAIEKNRKAEPAPQAAQSKHSGRSIDWNASFHGLGAALSSGKPNGSRGSQPNLAAFEIHSSKSKPQARR